MRNPVPTFSVTVIALCGGFVGAASPPASAHPRSVFLFAGTAGWGAAREVPGTASLNIGGNAAIQSVSCPAAGTCVATGFYFTGPENDTQAFVVSERDGRWGQAQPVSGIASLNTGDHARADSISRPSPGNCAVGGFYVDTAGRWQAFLASERKGRWGRAIEVPGTAALNVGGNANVDSASCWAPGDCVAGGYYEASRYNGNTAKWQSWVATQHNGTWGAFVVSGQGGTWGRPSRCPARPGSTPAATPRSSPCPARAPVGAAPVAPTPTGPATGRLLSSAEPEPADSLPHSPEP